MTMRQESDFIGVKTIPPAAYWGVHTARAVENFPITGHTVAHKPELLEFLHAASLTTVDLIEAAMRACDHFGDSEASRDQMRTDCANVPPHQRADLREHFRRSYPAP